MAPPAPPASSHVNERGAVEFRDLKLKIKSLFSMVGGSRKGFTRKGKRRASTVLQVHGKKKKRGFGMEIDKGFVERKWVANNTKGDTLCSLLQVVLSLIFAKVFGQNQEETAMGSRNLIVAYRQLHREVVVGPPFCVFSCGKRFIAT
ncbi:hypothetical protein OIU84_012538 [Salix udensis]|uniref:Uncharacterized protein n=1 Tax=Salix udensis TaxID=889485 RepID=A0AAD6JHS3_9ROSI|nr:hypothetical protein OIU84_012538 [Salix udensis]